MVKGILLIVGNATSGSVKQIRPVRRANPASTKTIANKRKFTTFSESERYLLKTSRGHNGLALL